MTLVTPVLRGHRKTLHLEKSREWTIEDEFSEFE